MAKHNRIWALCLVLLLLLLATAVVTAAYNEVIVRGFVRTPWGLPIGGAEWVVRVERCDDGNYHAIWGTTPWWGFFSGTFEASWGCDGRNAYFRAIGPKGGEDEYYKTLVGPVMWSGFIMELP